MADAVPSGPSSAMAVRRVLEDPSLVEDGLVRVDGALEITPELSVAGVFKDRHGRAALLVEAAGSMTSVLGQAALVRSAAIRARGLLGRLYRDQQLEFERPRVLVVGERLSDDLLRALRELDVGISGHELAPATGHAPISSPDRCDGDERTAEPASDSGSTGTPATRPEASPATDRSEPKDATGSESTSPPTAATPSASPLTAGTPSAGTNGNGSGSSRATSAPAPLNLVDEAKKKILRVSDEVEEEVDGDLVRFLVHDRVLAVLATGGKEFGLYVGDQPDRRRTIQDRDDLNRALDDIFRRFFSLSRAVKGSTGYR